MKASRRAILGAAGAALVMNLRQAAFAQSVDATFNSEELEKIVVDDRRLTQVFAGVEAMIYVISTALQNDEKLDESLQAFWRFTRVIYNSREKTVSVLHSPEFGAEIKIYAQVVEGAAKSLDKNLVGAGVANNNVRNKMLNDFKTTSGILATEPDGKSWWCSCFGLRLILPC